MRESRPAKTVAGYVQSRYVEAAGGTDWLASPDRGYLEFDAVNGRLLVWWKSNTNTGLYQSGWWVASIEGFTPLFEIMQTYLPAADDLAFRIPAHPEGLRAADHFDTYWGRVSDLPDISKAQPMACDYPATPPAVGQLLTVADSSPTPVPGKANYTVTAVNYGTERRYGRKLVNGVMSGRDPAILPACP